MGLAQGLDVLGEGEIKWTVLADDGHLFVRKHTAYYVLGSPCRLLSCQTFSEYTYGLWHAYEFVMRTYDPKNKSMAIHPSSEQEYLGRQLGLPTVTCMLDKQTNLPISVTTRDAFSKPTLVHGNICITDEKNQNLSNAQKELLHWDFRVGHLNFKAVQMLLQSKTLGDSNLKKAARKYPVPKCATCQYGKQKCRPKGAARQAPVPEKGRFL
jgi:hypothetical protein